MTIPNTFFVSKYGDITCSGIALDPASNTPSLTLHDGNGVAVNFSLGSGSSTIATIESADRALVFADNSHNLIGTGRTYTCGITTAGFGCAFKGTVTVNGTGGVTVTDVRTTGATNPWCSLLQTNVAGTTYDLVGSKP